MPSSLLIAIIDDDSAREAASDLVRAWGFNVASHRDADAFPATADVSQIACLVTDMRMAGMSGLARPISSGACQGHLHISCNALR